LAFCGKQRQALLTTVFEMDQRRFQMPTPKVPYRRWIIAVLVTVLLTPAYPATPSLAYYTTGWHSPSANAATSGGDGDGFETNPDNAYSDSFGFAANLSNGTEGDLTDRHIYYNYGFDIPSGSTIQGIQVRLDWHLNSLLGDNSMGVSLSWDGGTNWTTTKTDTEETIGTDHTAYLGGTSDTWGETWEADDFSDGNFRVRVECYSSEADVRNFYLDWVPVEVAYTEPPPPALSINNVTVTEGNTGTKPAVFSVTLSAASSLTVTVDYATANNTAMAGSDYIEASGTVTFTPGITSQPITVTVQGDIVDEINETYFVNLSNPTNATFADNQGLGTITDDDAPSLSCTTPVTTLTAIADTWIESAYPYNNHGGDSYLKTMPDPFSSPTERALVRFNLSSIPANSIVRCAELRVYEVDTNAAQTFYVHQASKNWNESEATWYIWRSGTGGAWDNIGGDYNPTAVGNFDADTTGYRSTRIDTLAQFWVYIPTSNYGVLLRSTTTGDTGEVKFQGLGGANEPKLLVDYLPTLTISGATVSEGGESETANAVFTVTLAAAHSLTVTVDYATADDTATGGSDYITASGTVTFTPGVTSQPITVTVQGDTLDELDETYFVNLSNPTNATIGSDGHGEGTITDDDAPPTVAFTAAGQSGAENTGTMTVTAQLDAKSGLDVTLPFIVGGTATSGGDQDYTITDSPMVIPAGSLTTTITITVNDDSLNENPETVVVTLGAPDNATPGTTTVHTATITDNDPEPTVDFSSDSYSVDEGDVTAAITVTLSAVSGRDVTVDYETTDGTATQPDDYTAASGTVTFTAGITTQIFTVDINDDVVYEGPETITLTLSSPVGATLDGNNPATLTIVDYPPALSINDVTVAEGNSGTVDAVFTVTLGSASSLLVTVDYATADNTATAGSDYIAASGTLTFESGVTNQTINVTVQGDTLDEFDETYFVNLSNATNVPIADGQGLGTIADDDGVSTSCATPVITLTATADTWIEKQYPNNNHGDDINLKTKPHTNQTERALIQFDLSSIPAYSAVTCAELRVSEVSTQTAQTIYVHQVTNSWNESEATWNYRTLALPWTATGGDYNSTPEWSFAADATGYRSSKVTALAQYWVNNPTYNSGVLLRSTPDNDTGQVQFESLDGSNPPQLLVDYRPALSISDVTVTEGHSGAVNAVFTVSLSFADVLTVTVDYATADDTASAGSDYIFASGTLTFTPGITNQTVTVAVQGDALDEFDETYFVNLSHPTHATIADGQGLGTITDDDPTPTLGFSSGSYSVGEGAGGATITVTLSAASGRIVTVDYATTSGGTATADQDYKPLNDTLAFVPGETSQTFAVPIINDSTDEPDETVNLSLSAVVNANVTLTNTILTIVDDDESEPLQSVYLPLILKGGGGPQCGPDNYEPNDSCAQAYGPLASDQIYESWISNCDLDTYKKSDYFYVVISTLNTINISLTNIPSGTDYDLYLYRNPEDDPDHWAARSIRTGSWETISYDPPATGRYYIRVYSYSGSSTSPYSLQVTYD
jgi:hypothetical protein